MANWLTRSLISPMVREPRRTAVSRSTTGTLFIEISEMSSAKFPSLTSSRPEYARALKSGELAICPTKMPRKRKMTTAMIQNSQLRLGTADLSPSALACLRAARRSRNLKM